jgi:cytochrome P450
MTDTAETMRTFFQDPYAAYHGARTQRVFRGPQGVWYAARYADVDAILSDKRFGKKSPPGTEQLLPPLLRERQRDQLAILNIDPPDHTRIRTLLVKAFSARRIEAMRPTVHQLVDGIIDANYARGSMDLMRDFAFPIPATIISDMLGIPDVDRDRFAALSNAIIAFGSGVQPDVSEEELRARGRQATLEFDAYLAGLLAHKRRHGGDDLTTALIAAEDQHGHLSEEELTQNVRLLFMAGHETTVNLIGNAIIALHKHPGELEKLKAQPSLMPRAVEEFLRFDSSVQQLPRIAQVDVEIGAQLIRAGEMVICMLGAANRDPDVYENAETLEVERSFVRSKSFGGGIHFCLGAQLARIETEIALNTLYARIPDLTLTDPAVQYPFNPFFRGPRRLDASWHPNPVGA